MPFDFSTWRSRLDQPIVNGLLLSLSLHLALLGLVQPAPGGGGGRGEPLVINARLVEATPNPPPKQADAVVEPVAEKPADAVVPPIPAAVKPPQALLTSIVPSPAPSLPVAPLPASLPSTPVAAASVPVASPAESKAGVPATSHAGASVPFSVGIDSTWYVARQVDVHARSIGSIIPEYPDEARRRNQEGSLKLMVKVDDLGRVRDVEVVEADLPGVFDAAALAAFRNAHFQPAMKDGHPVRYQAYIRVVFRLKD